MMFADESSRDPTDDYDPFAAAFAPRPSGESSADRTERLRRAAHERIAAAASAAPVPASDAPAVPVAPVPPVEDRRLTVEEIRRKYLGPDEAKP